MPATSWPAATSNGTSRTPITPLAPARKIRIGEGYRRAAAVRTPHRAGISASAASPVDTACDPVGMAVQDQGRRGVRRRLTDPGGKQYIVQAAPSGYVGWSGITAQSVTGWLYHSTATWLVHRLVFRGGWTVTGWQGDDIAPKRKVVARQRYRTRAEATAAMEDLATTVARSGPPSAK
jgi:hypothetical protein